MIDLAKELQSAIGLGVQAGMEALRQEAIVESSGTYTEAEFIALDRPYATRHATPLLDPSMINTHDPNGFISFWKVDDAIGPKELGVIDTQLINDSPVADFLVGRDRPKSKMVRRPIDDELEKTAPFLLEGRINQALRDFENKTFTIS
jgi:hypothetical protein